MELDLDLSLIEAICGSRIVAIISAFQAEDDSSILSYRSYFIGGWRSWLVAGLLYSQGHGFEPRPANFFSPIFGYLKIHSYYCVINGYYV